MYLHDALCTHSYLEQILILKANSQVALPHVHFSLKYCNYAHPNKPIDSHYIFHRNSMKSWTLYVAPHGECISKIMFEVLHQNNKMLQFLQM